MHHPSLLSGRWNRVQVIRGIGQLGPLSGRTPTAFSEADFTLFPVHVGLFFPVDDHPMTLYLHLNGIVVGPAQI